MTPPPETLAADVEGLADKLERLMTTPGAETYPVDADDLYECIRLLRSITEQREALALALQWLGELEPSDSRAVSNEFVAMACVLCGKADQACMDIIRAATKPPLVLTGASHDQ